MDWISLANNRAGDTARSLHMLAASRTGLDGTKAHILLASRDELRKGLVFMLPSSIQSFRAGHNIVGADKARGSGNSAQCMTNLRPIIANKSRKAQAEKRKEAIISQVVERYGIVSSS
jgi:hypothetical protein